MRCALGGDGVACSVLCAAVSVRVYVVVRVSECGGASSVRMLIQLKMLLFSNSSRKVLMKLLTATTSSSKTSKSHTAVA